MKAAIVTEHVIGVADLHRARGQYVAWMLWCVGLASFSLTAVALLLFLATGLAVAQVSFWIGLCIGGIVAAVFGFCQQWQFRKKLAKSQNDAVIVFRFGEVLRGRTIAVGWSLFTCSVSAALLPSLLFVPGLNFLAAMMMIGGFAPLLAGRKFQLLDRKRNVIEKYTQWVLVHWTLEARSLGEFMTVEVRYRRDESSFYPVVLTALVPTHEWKLLNEQGMEAAEACAAGECIARYLQIPIANKTPHATTNEDLVNSEKRSPINS